MSEIIEIISCLFKGLWKELFSNTSTTLYCHVCTYKISYTRKDLEEKISLYYEHMKTHQTQPIINKLKKPKSRLPNWF